MEDNDCPVDILDDEGENPENTQDEETNEDYSPEPEEDTGISISSIEPSPPTPPKKEETTPQTNNSIKKINTADKSELNKHNEMIDKIKDIDDMTEMLISFETLIFKANQSKNSYNELIEKGSKDAKRLEKYNTNISELSTNLKAISEKNKITEADLLDLYRNLQDKIEETMSELDLTGFEKKIKLKIESISSELPTTGLKDSVSAIEMGLKALTNSLTMFTTEMTSFSEKSTFIREDLKSYIKELTKLINGLESIINEKNSPKKTLPTFIISILSGLIIGTASSFFLSTTFIEDKLTTLSNNIATQVATSQSAKTQKHNTINPYADYFVEKNNNTYFRFHNENPFKQDGDYYLIKVQK